MGKYYIYLNGKPYIEIPEEYGIRQDVYMNYNDLIEQYLNDKGLGGRAISSSKKIEILKEFIANPQHTDMVIRHELTHIKQMQEIENFSLQYGKTQKKYGYKGNPYEVEARQWGNKYLPLHRIGTFDIDYQKQLEGWQQEKPKIFQAKAEEEKRLGQYQGQRLSTPVPRLVPRPVPSNVIKKLSLPPQDIPKIYRGYTPSSYKKSVTYIGKRRGGIFE